MVCKPILVFSLGLSQAEQYDVTHLISSHGHTEVSICRGGVHLRLSVPQGANKRGQTDGQTD